MIYNNLYGKNLIDWFCENKFAYFLANNINNYKDYDVFIKWLDTCNGNIVIIVLNTFSINDIFNYCVNYFVTDLNVDLDKISLLRKKLMLQANNYEFSGDITEVIVGELLKNKKSQK